MSAPTFQTIANHSRALAAGEYSSIELTEYYLTRIQAFDKHLNSFINVYSDIALQQAAKADACRARGEAGPLTGIPIAHKDIFCMKDTITSCASRMLKNFTAPYSATLVEQLNQAGTVVLGKLNMDEFAMGSANENSIFGPVYNPWDYDRVPGGSSGGSAAAVAARLIPGCTGTDTGGSIRQPAALCGITGLKPTYGRVSRYGMVAFASSLDQAGPMTQTAEDAALLLQHMAGHDKRDSTSLNEPVPDYLATLNDSIDGLRIGLPEQYWNDDLPEHIKQPLLDVIDQLETLGATCTPVSLPHTHLSNATYYVIAPAEASSNLARYDGVRYGYRCEQPRHLNDLYERSRTEGFGDEVKRRIMIGTYLLSAGFYDAYYLQAQKVRRLIRDDFHQAFQSVDLLLTPTTPNIAPKLGEKHENPVEVYLNDIFTVAVNLSGLPALSMPAGFHEQLPIGAQLIGPALSEGRLLNVAHQYQQVTDWHRTIPPMANANIKE